MESSDYEPAPEWRGHDFKKARAAFDVSAGRSYEEAKVVRKELKDLVPGTLLVTSPRPMFLDYDVTGSMGKWASVTVGKAPLLDFELKTEYLGEDYAVILGATGDANCDDYPMQVRPPTKGVGIKHEAEKLIIEGRGGGQGMETYELKGLYYARRVSMPNVLVKPPLIFIADEKPYPFVEPRQASTYAYVTLERRLPTKQVFEELKRKFSVYAVLKPYGDLPENLNCDVMRPIDLEIHTAWQELLEVGHVLSLWSPERVVDVIFGIMGKECDKVGYFRREIEHRQGPDKDGATKIAITYRSLEPLIGPPEAGNPYWQPAPTKTEKRGVKPLA